MLPVTINPVYFAVALVIEIAIKRVMNTTRAVVFRDNLSSPPSPPLRLEDYLVILLLTSHRAKVGASLVNESLLPADCQSCSGPEPKTKCP